MSRPLALSLAALLFTGSAALAQTPRMVMAAPPPPRMQSELGGGFIEFLFGAHNVSGPSQTYAPPPAVYGPPPSRQRSYADLAPAESMPQQRHTPAYRTDPQFLRQEVDYHGKQAPGTIVVDTPHHFLYLVEADGKAMRYGIGVARKGFSWSGVHKVTAKREWPDWIPPKEMLARQPYLPHRMTGGPNNPLGARALYIGHTLYRIHGSNEPWTIGHNVSSGCIRMRNADIIDLYKRVKVGTEVVVIGPHGSDRDYIPPPNTNPNDIERG